MTGRVSAAQEAAEKFYKKQPPDDKPTARQLSDRFNLSEAAIFQSAWWKNRKTGESK